jgi:hypothetical protein
MKTESNHSSTGYLCGISSALPQNERSERAVSTSTDITTDSGTDKGATRFNSKQRRGNLSNLPCHPTRRDADQVG